MKISLLLLALSFAIGGHSQNVYQNGTTVTANGITFKVKLVGPGFVLSNTANIYTNAPFRYKDGRELQTLDEYAMIDGSQKFGIQDKVLRESFSDSFIESMRRAYPAYQDCPMKIFYVIGPEGDTLEVAFIMHAVPELLSLSPEVFATLEQNLKKYVKWEVNEFGRKLQFTHASASIFFTKLPLSSELISKKPGFGFDVVPDSVLVK